MSKSQLSRLERLEEQRAIYERALVWVDLQNTRVRIDINHQRGEEVIFENVRDCVAWVEMQIAQFDEVAGVAFIDDVSELLEGEALALFNKIYDGAPNKGVLFGLRGRGKNSQDTITQSAIASWWHGLTGLAYQEWRAAVEDRIVALLPNGEC